MKTIIFVSNFVSQNHYSYYTRKSLLNRSKSFYFFCENILIVTRWIEHYRQRNCLFCWRMLGRIDFFLQLSRVHAQLLFAFERNCYLWDVDRRWSAAFTRLLPKLWSRFPLKPKPETGNEPPTENSVHANCFLPTSTPKETTGFPKTMSRKKKKYSSLAFICYAIPQSALKESRKLINILTTQRDHKMRST